MEPWTRGIQNAFAAFAGGDAIEAGARTREEQRLLAAANQRALLDDRLLRAQERVARRDARAEVATLVPDALERSLLLGELGPQWSAVQQGRLRQQEYGYHEGAFGAARAGDPNLANANLWGLADAPVAIPTIQGDTLIPNRFIEGGGEIKATPKGEAEIASANALAQQRQAKAAVDAAKESQVVPTAEALQAAARARAEASLASAANSRASADKKGVGGVSKPAETAMEAQRRQIAAFDAARGASLLPTGEPETLDREVRETNRREYEAAGRSSNPEAFHVTSPNIDPTVRTEPTAPLPADVMLTPSGEPAVKPKGAAKPATKRGAQAEADALVAAADAAIARGKDPDAVRARLNEKLAELGFSVAE